MHLYIHNKFTIILINLFEFLNCIFYLNSMHNLNSFYKYYEGKQIVYHYLVIVYQIKVKFCFKIKLTAIPNIIWLYRYLLSPFIKQEV